MAVPGPASFCKVKSVIGGPGVHVSEWLPTDKWVALTHQGEDVAEAWLEPDGDGFHLQFRVPPERVAELTVENLLSVADVTNDEVESWRIGNEPDGSSSQLNQPLPPVPSDTTHLTIHVRLKAPATVSVAEDLPPEKWQVLEASWKAILGLESIIDSLRLGMDGLRSEMESAFKRQMGVEEKLNALQGDIVQWNKAKSRVHYSIPKAREFVHRATWAMAVPERKRLEELFKAHIEPRVPIPEPDRVREQLEHLQKDRQIMCATGNAINQECRGLLGEIQRAYGTLQRNAADRARQKRSNAREKGKHF
jgi:hypothetical protein